jgi:hypothetical protein
MEDLITITIQLVNMIFDHVNLFLTSLSEVIFQPEAGGGVAFALAFGAVAYGNISEGVLAGVRRWHGSIDEQFGNIDNLVVLVTEHQQQWIMPPDLFAELTGNHSQLQTLINKCRTSAASTEDRTEATDEVAEVKVKVINEDFIRVVIDQSAAENAAQIVHGWPAGVRNALIVITSADGKTEVYRQFTTHLHNDIRMPDGSHGKQFIIKASFLKHVNDEPRFGNEPTFSMPLTTEDLAAALDRQHHEEFEAQMCEVERQRQEIERLQAEADAKK